MRIRHRQVDTTPNTEPERVEVHVPCPAMMEKHHTANAKIDQHNRMRQGDLKLERKIGVASWPHRADLSIFGIICVDACFIYTAATEQHCMSKEDFFLQLATELIDNTCDSPQARRRPATAMRGSPRINRAHHGRGIFLTPAKTMRKRCRDGATTNCRQQHRCRVCSKKSSHCCSRCIDDGRTEAQSAHCAPTGPNPHDCFTQHLQQEHVEE